MTIRPRLHDTINYFQSLERQNVNAASEVLQDYYIIKEQYGEFFAGRYIIDIYADMLSEQTDNVVEN